MPAACRLIEGVMGHDLLRHAREAYVRGKCRRETPITLRGVGGTLVEGNVDLAVEEDGEWKVIDFKTDQPLKAGLEKYRLLTETDGPFTNIGDRPSAPIDVKVTVDALSVLRGLTQENLAQTIRSNLRSLLERAGISGQN